MGQSRTDNPETLAALVTRHRMKKKQTNDERHGSHQAKTGEMDIVNIQLVRDDCRRSFEAMIST
jgi:hypothetical protein